MSAIPVSPMLELIFFLFGVTYVLFDYLLEVQGLFLKTELLSLRLNKFTDENETLFRIFLEKLGVEIPTLKTALPTSDHLSGGGTMIMLTKKSEAEHIWTELKKSFEDLNCEIASFQRTFVGKYVFKVDSIDFPFEDAKNPKTKYVAGAVLVYFSSKIALKICRKFRNLFERKQKDVLDVNDEGDTGDHLPDIVDENKTEDSRDDDLPPVSHSPSEDGAGNGAFGKRSETHNEPKIEVVIGSSEVSEVVQVQETQVTSEKEVTTETTDSDVVDSREEEENGHGRPETEEMDDERDDDDYYDDEYDDCYDYGERKSTRLYSRSSARLKNTSLEKKEKKDEKKTSRDEKKVPVILKKTKKVRDEFAVPEVIGMDLSLPGIMKGSKTRSSLEEEARRKRRINFETPFPFYKTERTEDQRDVHFEVDYVESE